MEFVNVIIARSQNLSSDGGEIPILVKLVNLCSLCVSIPNVCFKIIESELSLILNWRE